jgi:hypothetical protein
VPLQEFKAGGYQSMTLRTVALLLFVIGFAVSPSAAQSSYSNTKSNVSAVAVDHAADAAAIRAHIESIFQAFIDADIDKIFKTHSEDWRGFLEGSRTPIKGIDEYMRANGFEWPRAAGAPKL